jgi:hypothetical protein
MVEFNRQRRGSAGAHEPGQEFVPETAAKR